jgi:hypothetical protein
VIKSKGGGTFLTGQTKPEIDIKQITYAIEGTTLTLELEMHGDIQLVDPYAYYVTVETIDFQYSIVITNDEASASVFDNDGSDYPYDDPEATVDGTKLSAVFELSGDYTVEEVYGHAEYLVQEMLQDWAPDSRNPLYELISDDDTPPSDDDNDDDDSQDDNSTGDGGTNGTGMIMNNSIDDPENDVYYIDSTLPPGSAMTQNIGDKPNVDIRKVSCVIGGGTLTLKLEVANDGIIKTDSEYSYNIVLKTSDGGLYTIMVNYAGAGGMGIGPATPAESAGGTLEISKNIIQMEWVFKGNATVEDLYADASYKPTEKEIYRDIAPDTNQDSGEDDDTDDDTGDEDDDATGNNLKKPSTPGFELIAVIAAVGITFILLKRRK